MYAMPPERCAALYMCMDILKELRIIVTIPRAAPVATVARTTTIPAWGIFLSIAMGMAAPILMSIKLLVSKLIAAVAMTLRMLRKVLLDIAKTRMTTARAGMSISMSTSGSAGGL